MRRRPSLAGQVLMTIAEQARSPGRSAPASCARSPSPRTSATPAFPDVPTLAEAGVPDMAISLWTGLVAPAGTPAEIVALLNKAIVETLALPEVRTALDKIAVDAAQHHARAVP